MITVTEAARLTSETSCDLDGFTSLIHSMLKAAWGQEWGTFCEAFPNGRDPENVALPVITYSVMTKRPGTVGNHGTREIKPRVRQEVIKLDGNANAYEAVTIYAQIFDCEIGFDLWEQSNTALNKLAERFEDFMMVYAGYFKSKGVADIFFDRMLNNAGASWREDILSRSYVYLVRIEKQILVPQSVIKEVIGQVEIIKDLSDDSQALETIKF